MATWHFFNIKRDIHLVNRQLYQAIHLVHRQKPKFLLEVSPIGMTCDVFIEHFLSVTLIVLEIMTVFFEMGENVVHMGKVSVCF